ncbi:hypothetical protein Tco_0180825 [Tanacetum coccineum]
MLPPHPIVGYEDLKTYMMLMNLKRSNLVDGVLEGCIGSTSDESSYKFGDEFLCHLGLNLQNICFGGWNDVDFGPSWRLWKWKL